MKNCKKNIEIPDLKISEKLHERNPFKPMMHRLENNKKNGNLFKFFCLAYFVVIIFFQIVFIAKYGVEACTVLPLTLFAIIVIYNSYYFCSYDVNHVWVFKRINVYFLYICSALLFLGLTNLFILEKTNLYVFVDYAIIVGVVSFLIPVGNKFYFLYQNYRDSYFSNSFSTKMKIVLIILFLYIGYIAIPIFYRDIFMQNNIVFVSCLIVTVCYFIGAVFRILFLVSYILLRKTALKVNNMMIFKKG